MKPKKIIIAAAAIIILASLLSGCSKIEEAVMEKFETPTVSKTPSVPKTDIEKTVEKAAAAKKEVDLKLDSEEADGKVKVTVTLDNPNKKPITSVQSWLSFDPDKVQGDEIDVSESAFSLPAPYDNAFDNENGLVMLGRSNTTPVSDESIPVAVIYFKVLDEEGATIDAYDYRADVTGHTSANTIVDGTPYNIMVKPESPTLIIK